MTTALDAAAAAALDQLDDTTPAGRVHAARPEPYITALPCSRLIVDHTYQRDLDHPRVGRMVAEFDRTLLGVIEVSDRGDGTYAILEGQHRWAAVHIALGPASPLVCQVHRGLSRDDEARVFYEIDRRRKALTGWDRWKARRASGDAAVLELDELADEVGMRVAPGGGRDGYCQSAGALERALQRGGAPLVRSTLQILSGAYGTRAEAYTAELITAVAEVVEAYQRELDADRLIATLTGTTPAQLKARAAALAEFEKGTRGRLVAAVLVKAYNDRPGRNLPAFFDRVAQRAAP